MPRLKVIDEPDGFTKTHRMTPLTLLSKDLIMNITQTTRTLRNASALAVALFAALSVQAADLGQDNYRRAVLGDTSVQAPQTTVEAQRVVPGFYARYLINNGMDSDQALATAQASGETPTVESTQHAVADSLSGFQRYERAMGRSIAG